MGFTKTDLKYYRLRKIPSLKGVVDYSNNTVSIHQVINDKVKYDPFEMKRKGTAKHNLFALMFSKYKRVLKARTQEERDQFINFLDSKNCLRKYKKRFLN